MNIRNAKCRWEAGAALCTAGMLSIVKSFQNHSDCMQVSKEMQTLGAVKDFTSGSLPFENGEFERTDEVRRVLERIEEEQSNTQSAVWQYFEYAPSEVRKAGTIERKNVLK